MASSYFIAVSKSRGMCKVGISYAATTPVIGGVGMARCHAHSTTPTVPRLGSVCGVNTVVGSDSVYCHSPRVVGRCMRLELTG